MEKKEDQEWDKNNGRMNFSGVYAWDDKILSQKWWEKRSSFESYHQ